MSTFDFSLLTPDLILDGLESVGFTIDSGLLAMNSYENRVYLFNDDNGTKYVTKFYRPARWQVAQIQEEHQFSFELANAELPIVAPLLRDGQSLFEYQGFYFAVFPCLGGRSFEVDNLDHLEWMGRFIGRIHAVGAKQPFEHRLSFNAEEFLHQAKQTIEQSGFVSANVQLPFFTILDQVIPIAEQQYQPESIIRLHGDCHAGNILWREPEGPHFVDLDDCRQGPAIQDLWMMLSGDRQQQLLQLDTLLSGYEEFFSFDSSELSLIESLRTMRVVNYMAWLCKRWSDPAFPHNFPWFNTEKYWEQQVLMLKEQYAQLTQPPLRLF